MSRRRLRVSLLLVMAAGRSAQATAPEPMLRVAACDHPAREYTLLLDSRVTLARALLDPALSDEEHIAAAARQQIKFIWGHLRTDPVARQTLKFVLSAEAPAIEVVARRSAPYGRDLVIDWVETPALHIEDDYTLRAVRKRRLAKQEPALHADYRAQVKVMLCGDGASEETSLAAPLPDDPWLAHWYVPASERRRLRYFAESAIAPPCVDDDYADLPHPFYLWYDWQPERRGPDANGRRFDCRRLLRPGRDYTMRTARLVALPQSGGGLSSLHQLGDGGALRATVLIGVLEHEWRDLDLAGLASEINQLGDPAAAARRALALPRPRERGAAKVLALLADLPPLMRIERAHASVERGYLDVVVEGELRQSRRPLRLRLAYGVTDVFGPTPPSHWQIAREALAHDHIVAYAGHSGIGENMKLARIARGVGLPEQTIFDEVSRAPYQIVAFLSCYSYMYFGLDLVSLGKARREFVYTGTPFSTGDRGALALLDLVDRALAGEDLASAKPLLHHVEPADFMIVKGFR